MTITKTTIATATNRNTHSNGNKNILISSDNVKKAIINKVSKSEDANKENILPDGRRTLIKNQLYLIEQLQLENAYLRNERDQLQLENEELKFQLQMISSSSNCLMTVAGPTAPSVNLTISESCNPTIETITTNTITATTTTIPSTTAINTVESSTIATSTGVANLNEIATNNQQNLLNLATVITPIRNRTTNPTIITSHRPSSKVLSTIHATPLRRPIKQQQQLPNQYHLETKATERLLQRPLINIKNNNNEQRDQIGQINPLHGQQLAYGSSCGPNSLDEVEDENERLQIQLVEQRFGDDLGRLSLAAIVIQRAFRRYQIYQRFRAITEQLRQTTSITSGHHISYDISFNSDSTPDSKSISVSGNRLNYNNDDCERGQEYLERNDDDGDHYNQENDNDNSHDYHPLTQVAQQLIANTTNKTNTPNAAAGYTPIPAVKKAFSSHHVNELGSPDALKQHHVPARGHQINNNIDTTATTCQTNQSPSVHNLRHVETHRALLYRVGLNIFNRNPDKGISYFIAHNFIESTNLSVSFYLSNRMHFVSGNQSSVGTTINQNQQYNLLNKKLSAFNHEYHPSCRECLYECNIKRNVADFLATRRGLSREKIGLYLGNLQEQFNQDVLKYYLASMDFTGLQVDVALRKFLSGFRLPGEAQKIERMVENFATRYVQCQTDLTHLNHLQSPSPNHKSSSKENNKIILLTRDEIFILSFAIIMLNTDLHSPSLKPASRMSAQQFVNNLRGLFKSQPVEANELIDIYNRIKGSQINTLPDHLINLVHVQRRLTVANNFQRKEVIPNLCQPHRRMVCFCRVHEVYDPNKKERAGQHQREVYLFNDIILVCKIARRTRSNTEPQLALRNSISLQGLGVELFQSTHYEFGIRLFQVLSNTTVMMFNSVNKQDQVRFTRDLQDSIAEMKEMDEIKNKNIVDLIHVNFVERLRKHTSMHNPCDRKVKQQQQQQKSRQSAQDKMVNISDHQNIIIPGSNCDTSHHHSDNDSDNIIINNNNVVQSHHQISSSFGNNQNPLSIDNKSFISDKLNPSQRSDMSEPNNTTIINGNTNSRSMIDLRQNDMNNSNLATVGSINDPESTSSVASLMDQPRSISSTDADRNMGNSNKLSGANGKTFSGPGNENMQKKSTVERKSSATSVFSHDSGLFLSRDISPNQSS